MGLMSIFTPSKEVILPPAPEIIQKNLGQFDLQKSQPSQDPKALHTNPMMLLDALGFKDRPSSLSYNILRRMATRNAVVASIIVTRCNQVSSFTKPARFSKDGLGYEIRSRDPKKVLAKEELDVVLAMELFLENCGFDDDNTRDNFDEFIKKITRDSLTYDQACFEVVPDRKGRPSTIHAVDASTIRFASEDFVASALMQVDPPKSNQEVRWVQVLDNVVLSWFTNNELAFGVRNPRSDINIEPYGFSELEQLVHIITSHLYAEEYNMRFFSQGGTTKGILNLKSDLSTPGSAEQLEAFKRQWRAQVSGMSGAWKTPVLSVKDGLEYINMSTSNREMEFEKWMNYLINIACAVYQIDPAEINFPNNGGVGGGSGGIFESNNANKLQNSKDKGLRPLLRFLESMINKYIISRFDNEFVFNFVGIDAKTDAEVLDLDTKAVKTYKTVNEIRKERDLEPLENADIILDPSFINMTTQKEMQAQQQAMMGGGAGGEEVQGEEETQGYGGAEENDEDYDYGEEEDDYEDYGEEEDDYEDYGDIDEEYEDEEEENKTKKSEILEIIIT